MLLERHRPLLLALCRRALGDREAAEEAAQEAVLQALFAIDSLRRPERFGAWLGGIGLNVCRQRLRLRARDAWSWEVLQGGVRRQEPIDLAPGPAEMAEAAELRERVRRAVDGLPHGQRAAVLLFYLSGLTHAETAAQLGIAVGAVKTRLHKARRALRRELVCDWSEWRDDAMAQQQREAWVEVRVMDIRRSKPGNDDGMRASVIILEEIGAEEPRYLPIWVGPSDGAALALALEKEAMPRPMTFQFTASLLDALSGRVDEVRVTRLEQDTYFAEVSVARGEVKRSVDARPSDAINLAVLVGARIHVARDLLDLFGKRHTSQIAATGNDQLDLEPGHGAKAIVAEIREFQARSAEQLRQKREQQS